MELIVVAMSAKTTHCFGYAHAADEGEEGTIYGYDFSNGVFTMSVWLGAELVLAA